MFMAQSTEAILRAAFHAERPEWPADPHANDAILKAVRHHGIAPLLWYQHHLTGMLEQWPETLVRNIRQQAQQESVAEIIREEELRSILQVFDAEGIDALLIKGTPLSASLYPATGLRPRCDTDILVPADVEQTAADVFKAHGYSTFFEGTGDYLNSQSSFRRRDTSGFMHAYDLHRQVSNASIGFSRHLTFSRLMDQSIEVPSLGSNARTLAHVDALLLACMHRAGHFAEMGERLIWLYDIHLLLESLSPSQQERLLAEASALRIRHLCAEACVAAQGWFATSVPQGLIEALRNGAEDEASAALLMSGRESRIRHTLRMDLQEVDSWRERGRLVMQRLFPPADYMTWRYQIDNRLLLPLYYLFRLLQGVRLLARRRH